MGWALGGCCAIRSPKEGLLYRKIDYIIIYIIVYREYSISIYINRIVSEYINVVCK